MATDTVVQQTRITDRARTSILRRAYEWQECFAWEEAESVANATAFYRPGRFIFKS
jgi:hypothetical protein